MTASAPPRRAPSPPMWWPAVLVFGLLVGLVGMHGMGFGASAVAGSDHLSAHSAHAAHSAHSAHSARPADSSVAGMRLGTADMWGRSGGEAVCRSDSDGDGGGHAQHADVNCASAALGTGPGLAAPLPTPFGPAAGSGDGVRSADIGREGGRAPPSLSELQLLRI
ncbi:DUF6153 family protein [Streptomyces sp. NPDC047000]|uniref:DUF6153 family protein n=1 Tax=Streptomyces sp. NPDC047000 TaxID=3155474 RepID=UPI0033DCACFF